MPMSNSLLIIIVWISIISFKISIAPWIKATQPLPNAEDEMAVGAWDGKILLFGAYYEPRQLTEIDTSTKTVTDLGRTALSADVSGGFGQYWTQIDHIVYILDENAPQFNIYNMIDRTYTTNWMDITIHTEPGGDACLASDSLYLYVVGGKATSPIPLTTLQILSILTQTWLTNPPSMNQRRQDHACVAHNGYLWVFGGVDESELELAVNERISTTSILSNSWDDTIDPLIVAVAVARSVGYYDTIYVTGGYIVSTRVPVDIVQLVDANTGTVTVSPDRMPEATAWHSPIIWDDVLYVFGGFYQSRDDWAYYQLTAPLGSVSPTQSSNPSISPSFYPTALPSKDPTDNPTSVPTDDSPISSNVTIFSSMYATVASSNDPSTSHSSNVSSFLFNQSTPITDDSKYFQTTNPHDGGVDVKETEGELGEKQKRDTFSFSMLVTIGAIIAVIGVVSVSAYLYRRHLSRKEVELADITEMEERKGDGAITTVVATVVNTQSDASDIASGNNDMKDGDDDDDDDDDDNDSLYDIGPVTKMSIGSHRGEGEQEGENEGPELVLVNNVSDSENLYVTHKFQTTTK